MTTHKTAKVAPAGWFQQFKDGAPSGYSSSIIQNTREVVNHLRKKNGRRKPILTLGHLAFETKVPVKTLRAWVARRDSDAYRTFMLAKGGTPSRGYRMISVPRPDLKHVQRWICDNILALEKPHSASKAYTPKSTLVEAVEPHLGCRWLIKLDLHAFFDSIPETSVYKVFEGIGYQPLVAIELARICTRLSPDSRWRAHSRWQSRRPERYSNVKGYAVKRLGYLPQGAPTSPMLSNLVMRVFDADLTAVAVKRGFQYTRYADDLAFSTKEMSSRNLCGALITDVYKLIAKYGLAPNLSKTAVTPPGGRKLLLGLLIDGEKPRLTKEFREELNRHLYFIDKYGVQSHADHRKFESIYGLRHHLFGLAYYARQIDPTYGQAVLARLNAVPWPI
ncbi:reverse transcriptase family protein [Burkholderia cepacia]|uniref:reverse transcriptase family protein n=1 Tax=Burkholderia cepacia TaxID=292 RepID=UPI00398EFF09